MTNLEPSRWTLYRHGDFDWHIAPNGSRADWDERTTVVEVMPVPEHEAAMKPLERSIKNQREENRHLIRQLEEERSGTPETESRLRHQLERANSALARSTNRGRHAEAALAALRATVHGNVQVIRGMCTDELDHREIDRALVRLDDAMTPAEERTDA